MIEYIENLPIEFRSKPHRVGSYLAFSGAAALIFSAMVSVSEGMRTLSQRGIVDQLTLFLIPIPLILIASILCWLGIYVRRYFMALLIDERGLTQKSPSGVVKYLWAELSSVEYITYTATGQQQVLRLNRVGETRKEKKRNYRKHLIWNDYEISDENLEQTIKAGIERWGSGTQHGNSAQMKVS
jgi:hypothetical protein